MLPVYAYRQSPVYGLVQAEPWKYSRTMFDQLPAELHLKTLTHLDVRDLRNAQLVSRHWHDFFIANESSIYRHAAVNHGFTCDSQPLADAKSSSPPGSMVEAGRAGDSV